MKKYNQLKEQDQTFFDKHKKEILTLVKLTDNFEKISADLKDDLHKISLLGKKEKRDDISKQADLIYKVISEAFGFANKLMNLEKLIKK